MTSPEQTLQQLTDHFRDVAKLTSLHALMEWDERTRLPVKGGAYRAEQSAYLSGLIHQRFTAPAVGDWLSDLADSDLASDPFSVEGATVRDLRRRYDKERCLPQSLARPPDRGRMRWSAVPRRRQ